MASGDIKLIWDEIFQQGDFEIADGDLVNDDGLQTAVLLSLHTDARANPDDILPDQFDTNRRGWWGDAVSPEAQGDRIGSRLWLLERASTTEDILTRAKLYAEESLQWLIEDEIAKKINVVVERQGKVGNDRLAILVEIFKTDGNEISLQYDKKWEETLDAL